MKIKYVLAIISFYVLGLLSSSFLFSLNRSSSGSESTFYVTVINTTDRNLVIRGVQIDPSREYFTFANYEAFKYVGIKLGKKSKVPFLFPIRQGYEFTYAVIALDFEDNRFVDDVYIKSDVVAKNRPEIYSMVYFSVTDENTDSIEIEI